MRASGSLIDLEEEKEQERIKHPLHTYARAISPDRIPADIKTDIDELFPKSEGRRRIAYTLMFWNRKLNTKEQEDLSR